MSDQAQEDALPPSADDLAAIAERIIASFPSEIRRFVRLIPIRIQDWPDEQHLSAVDCEDPLDLTGLYAGVPIGQRDGLALPPSEPEMIYLFRQPILFEWCQRDVSISDVLFDVLAHELGHHFGLDEAAATALEQRD